MIPPQPMIEHFKTLGVFSVLSGTAITSFFVKLNPVVEGVTLILACIYGVYHLLLARRKYRQFIKDHSFNSDAGAEDMD